MDFPTRVKVPKRAGYTFLNVWSPLQTLLLFLDGGNNQDFFSLLN